MYIHTYILTVHTCVIHMYTSQHQVSRYSSNNCITYIHTAPYYNIRYVYTYTNDAT